MRRRSGPGIVRTTTLPGWAWLRRRGLPGLLPALAGLLLGLSGLRAAPAEAARPAIEPAAAAALHDLRAFASLGRVLYVAAHPDDENTQLIAFLSRVRGYDVAYLSITRGDGGQNLLGPQLDEKLGVARTQELLVARQLDGGRQFFTRAIDFGFSKTPAETLSLWDRREVLGDVVRVIRQFRPDVIISRFPVPPLSGGHGQHTAAGILAREAFKAAADPAAYPEQMAQGLAPWQAKRIFWNVFLRGGESAGPTLKLDAAGQDPVTGEAISSIAARSRAMHKTQAFGDFTNRPAAPGRPARSEVENLVLWDGEPATSDLMDGVDTSWARIPGGAPIGELAKQAIATFQPDHPGASVPVLLELRRRVADLPPHPLLADKRAQLDEVIQHCLGLEVTSLSSRSSVLAGETVPVHAALRVETTLPVRWLDVTLGTSRTPINEPVSATGRLARELNYAVPADAPLTQPYWLRSSATVGMYGVDEPRLIGRPENPPDLPVTYTVQVDGQVLTLRDRLQYAEPVGAVTPESPAPTKLSPVAIVPRVTLSFVGGPAVVRPGAKTRVVLELVASRAKAAGHVALEPSEGWTVSAPQPFALEREGDRVRLTFEVAAPSTADTGSLGAVAECGGRPCRTDSITIQYPHIPRQLLQPAARLRLVSVPVETRGRSVGYVMGAGDDVPDALRQLGYEVTLLNGATITAETLRAFDAVVVGVRAFNTRADVATLVPALNAYVEAGGTVVAQYNWERNLKQETIAPFRLHLSGRRVTNEDAAVTFLAPEHPVLTTPNRITAADFAGWVQERGVYFPDTWDAAFVPVLAMHDPGEEPLQGALLVASYGRGHYVYTGLAFFRQLPAGVPGAYRLFANLVSLGQSTKP
ncbi:PIG-L family deacetylase [Opitutus sp. ER46]|uniref:PIG-L family deacetylase n=1 Tax=Opitutus sp. ER46 TaxID=2161864 RepID=UPI000D309B77|nr:PIG-L family deacetylase [Opitutus sp. ER46]PTX94397.1 LmbE family protein [Opitutus sp. ER46]